VKPIIKWAGGKSRLLKHLLPRVPSFSGRYFEPFLGGGAMLFALEHANAQASDVNKELIEFYSVVRDDSDGLLKDICGWKNDEETFYAVREMDRDAGSYSSLSPSVRAARFLYLNKTCFNGLYRTGKTGFNTPWGHGTDVIINECVMKSAADYLQNIELRCCGFEEALSEAKKDDFVYLDPPYVPLKPDEKWFSGYGVQFGMPEQIRLKDLCLNLKERGVNGMLSNSDTPQTRELYDNDVFNVDTLMAPRAISQSASGRKSVSELLVSW